MADIKERIVIESVDNTTRGMRTAQNKLNAFDRTLKRVQTTLLGFVGINIATHMIRGLTRMSDSAVELDAKLRLMTDSTEDFNYAQSELVKLSLESGSSLEANTILFTRMNKAIKQMGGNTQTTLDTTRALSQGLRISGASTQESASVIRQWSQAMASGVLRGEEFNAVSENGARIIRAISESLGVSIGELREMSKEGELTAQTVTRALLQQSQVLQEENSKLPLTIGRAIENINTQWILLMQDMSKGNSSIADVINVLAENFQLIASTIKTMSIAAGAYVAINIAKYLREQAAGAAESIRASKAQAKATLLEKQAQEELIINKHRADAIEKRLALTKANSAVAAIKHNIAETQAVVQRISLTNKELELKVRQLKWEIRSQTAKQGNILARKQLIALEHRATLSSEALRIAKMRLAGAEHSLTSAVVAQTKAYNANSLAQKRNIASSSKGLKKLSTGIKSFISNLASIDVLLTGFLGYEFGTWLYDNFDWARKGGVLLNWILQQLIVGFQFLSEVVAAVFTGDTIGNAWDRYMERLEQVNEITADMYENTSIKANETVNRIKDANLDRVASSIETTEKLKELEEELLEATQSKITNRYDLEKIALGQRISDKAEFDAALLQLDAETEELRTNAILESSNRQLGYIQEFYDQEKELRDVANEQLILNDQELNDKRREANVDDFNEYHDQFVQFNKVIQAQQKSHNETILKLSTEQAQKLREVSQDTLDALVKHANTLASKQRSAIARGKSVIKEAADFVKEINGDQRKSYEKLADAHKTQREIEQKLREASASELKGDHDVAQALREEALTKAQDLTNEYKDIADNSKKGSLTQVQANAQVKKSLDLVTQSAKDVKKSTDAIAKSAGADLEVRKSQIAQYQEIINKLDEQITKTRNVEVGMDTGKIYSQIEAIDQKIKSLNQDVVVNVKSRKVGVNGTPVERASGGFIPRNDRVPGTGSGDKVKALLEPGEFIIRKAAVQKYGEAAMYALNRGDDDVIKRQSGGIIPGIQKFANGGKVNVSVYESKYSSLLDRWIRIAQNPPGGSGITRTLTGNIAKLAVQKIQQMIETLAAYANSTPDKVSRVETYNDKLIRSLRERMQFSQSQARTSTLGGLGKLGYRKSVEFNNKIRVNEKLLESAIQLLNGGGLVQRFNNGGSVLGSGLGDTVKALLTPGEFVMKKSSVQQFGSDFMNSINQGIMPQRFANGGMVGANGADIDTINVNFNVNGSQATGTFVKNDATMTLIETLKSAEASS